MRVVTRRSYPSQQNAANAMSQHAMMQPTETTVEYHCPAADEDNGSTLKEIVKFGYVWRRDAIEYMVLREEGDNLTWAGVAPVRNVSNTDQIPNSYMQWNGYIFRPKNPERGVQSNNVDLVLTDIDGERSVLTASNGAIVQNELDPDLAPTTLSNSGRYIVSSGSGYFENAKFMDIEFNNDETKTRVVTVLG